MRRILKCFVGAAFQPRYGMPAYERIAAGKPLPPQTDTYGGNLNWVRLNLNSINEDRPFGIGAWGKVGVLDAKKLSHQHQQKASHGVTLFGEKHKFVQVIKSIDNVFRAPGYHPVVLLKVPRIEFIGQFLAAKFGFKIKRAV